MIKNGKYIVQTLSEHGHEGYFVGGYVRDMLLKRPSNDIDIATNAHPEKVVEIFTAKGHTVVPTGIAHGTVTVVVEGEHLEVTTYREDVSCDGRNATIRYAETVETDLSRRDFTMNAIAYCPIKEQFIDPYNGVEDIKYGKIRTVGDARQRFSEDYLRMFRAFRFEVTLNNFELDVKDLCELNGVANREDWMERLSAERIKTEIDKVFKNANDPSYFISQLHWNGILCPLIPEVSAMFGVSQHKWHSHDVWNHTLKVLNAVPKEFPLIRWAALFHDLGKVPAREWCEKKEDWTFHNHEEHSVELASVIMDRLKFSNDDKEEILHLIANHMKTVDEKMKKPAVRRFIKNVGIDNLDSFMVLKEADKRGNDKKSEADVTEKMAFIKSRIEEVFNSVDVPVFETSALVINGADVMEALNIAPGPEVGRVLKALLEIVLDNPELNNQKDLLRLVEEV